MTKPELIRTLLKRRGWRQSDLAKRVGLTQNAVARWVMHEAQEPSPQSWTIILTMWDNDEYDPLELIDPTYEVVE